MARFAGGDGSTLGAFALHCRGDVRLYCGTTDCTPKSKKGRALLAVLAAEQRPLSRLKIIDLLWSDSQEEQARASLRTLLADLKEQFNSCFDQLLTVDRERIALGAGVRTDLTDPALARPAGELFEGLDHLDPELDEWLRVEREKWASGAAAVVAESPRHSQTHATPPRWGWVAFLLLSLTAGALLYFSPWKDPEQPVVAVLRFNDLTGKNALLAQGLAEELRIQLAQRAPIKVLGRLTSEANQPGISAPVMAKELFGATHVVEGSILFGTPARVSVRLVDTRSGKTIWNQVVAANVGALSSIPGGLIYNLADQISQTAEQVGSPAAFEADSSAYLAVFRARQLLQEADPGSKLEARQLLAPVLVAHPNFAPALAAMANATILSSDYSTFGGPIPYSRARPEAETYARRAIKAAPRYALGYWALGIVLVDTDDGLAALRHAAELSPGDAGIQASLGRTLYYDWRNEEALPHSRLAVELNPLRVPSNVVLMRILHLTGRDGEVWKVAQKFFRVSRSERDKWAIRSEAEALSGEYGRSLVSALKAHELDPDDAYMKQFVFNAYMTLEAPKLARPFVNMGTLEDLLITRNVDGVLRYARASGADFWAMGLDTNWAAEFLVAEGQEAELVALYESAPPSPASLDDVPPAVIVALKQKGRTVAARALLQRYRSYVDRLPAHEGTPGVQEMIADVLALSGKCNEALIHLARARKRDWWNTSDYFQSPFERSTLACLHGKPGFRVLEMNYRQRLNAERAKAAAALRRIGKATEAQHLLSLIGMRARRTTGRVAIHSVYNGRNRGSLKVSRLAAAAARSGFDSESGGTSVG